MVSNMCYFAFKTRISAKAKYWTHKNSMPKSVKTVFLCSISLLSRQNETIRVWISLFCILKAKRHKPATIALTSITYTCKVQCRFVKMYLLRIIVDSRNSCMVWNLNYFYICVFNNHNKWLELEFFFIWSSHFQILFSLNVLRCHISEVIHGDL